MHPRFAVPLLAAAVTAALPSPASAAPLPSCKAQQWLGAWSASPTDAGAVATSLDKLIASAIPSPDISNSTVRAVLSPTYRGSTLRVRLSNRFGTKAITFRHATIAKRTTGAAIAASTLKQLRFSGRASVRVAAGKEVFSDAVRLSFRAFQDLAVSVHVPEDVGKGTRHAVARQTSFATAQGAGDATSARDGKRFTLMTTTRPFVTGIDVRAPRSAGAVVALGSSLTDGTQNQENGILESTEGLDKNVRYPDWLARRLGAARRPLSVLNAGIGGNRILQDGPFGDNLTLFGPSALKRVVHDVVEQGGVTTAIVWMGINDISQKPRATPEAVIAGFEQLFARLHRAGIRVVQGTISPFKGYPVTRDSGEEDEEARRVALNQWIRTKSTADVVVDFDRVVRDPTDPTRLAPRYDDGEHLHFSTAGYKAIAAAVPLNELATPRCRRG